MVLSLYDIDSATIEITHYYGLSEVRYEGVWHAAFGFFTRWRYAWIHVVKLKDAICRFWFDRMRLTVGNRLAVLADVLAASEH